MQRDADARLRQLVESATGPAPCDRCPKRAKCAAELLACEAYGLFFHHLGESRWRDAPRAPTHARWLAVMEGKPGRRRGRRPPPSPATIAP